MKKLRRMIKDVKKMISDVVIDLFDPNEDGFMEALGVDPEKYKHVAPDGTVGYDFMTAMYDTAAESWSEYMADSSGEDVEFDIEVTEMPQNNNSSADDWSEDPRKFHYWNILTAVEKEQALKKYAEVVGLPVEQLPKPEVEKPKEKTKYKKMFDWG